MTAATLARYAWAAPVTAIGLAAAVLDKATGRELRPTHLGAPTARGTIVTSDDFLIVALAIFAIVKVINRLRRQPPPPDAPPPAPTEEQKLLGEIRDLLKARA